MTTSNATHQVLNLKATGLIHTDDMNVLMAKSPAGRRVLRAAISAGLAEGSAQIVTELAVIRPTENGLFLQETAPGVSVHEVIEATEASLILAPGLVA